MAETAIAADDNPIQTTGGKLKNMASESILSVGIDIGTSTTSMAVSRMTVSNTASCFAVPHLDITDKKVIYRGKIYQTPQLSGERLDIEALKSILEKEYHNASVTPGMVESGAVIITGESSRKDNAKLVTSTLSGIAGDFVVATAGPDLEAVIAAKGAGAQQFSDDKSCKVVNFDIGGGTSNIAVFSCGELKAKGSWDIGGRLARFDASGRIVYVSERLLPVAQDIGVRMIPGNIMGIDELAKVTNRMASLLAEAVGLLPRTALCEAVHTETGTLIDISDIGKIDCVTFSGGVAEAYYNPPANLFCYGDIGPLLAESLHSAPGFARIRIERPKETIRATVIGAGSYTTTISGSTIDFSSKELFPLQNLPAVLLSGEEEAEAFCGNAAPLIELLKWSTRENDSKKLLICLTHTRNPSYLSIGLLADAIIEAHAQVLGSLPILVSTGADFAEVLGKSIKRRLPAGRDVICIDEVHIEFGDYIDLGHPLADGTAIPVVVKTLMFG